jgi:F0F1-type ATP synthase assembly protein I
MLTSGTDDHGSAGVESNKRPDLIPREFLSVIAVWSLIPAYALAGAFLGWLVDKWLDTSPYGLGVGLLVALAVAVRDMMRLRNEFLPPSGGESGD